MECAQYTTKTTGRYKKENGIVFMNVQNKEGQVALECAQDITKNTRHIFNIYRNDIIIYKIFHLKL